MDSSQQQREIDFHNEWANSTSLDKVRVAELFESPVAMENRWILHCMGDLKGKKLLDIGAGLGESSVYFALQGAQVTCTDISPGMVELAQRLALHHGTTIEGIVTPGETIEAADGQFDIVYIANTIHHVSSKEKLFSEIHRVLKPNGRFFSIDPLAYNPVINVYRNMATEVRTEDEAPLSLADLDLVKRHFRNVQHREFWIATLLLFLKYYLIDRVHPNQERYWKRIFEETTTSLAWWLPIRSLDSVLTRIPLVKLLAWNIVMWGEK